MIIERFLDGALQAAIPALTAGVNKSVQDQLQQAARQNQLQFDQLHMRIQGLQDGRNPGGPPNSSTPIPVASGSSEHARDSQQQGQSIYTASNQATASSTRQGLTQFSLQLPSTSLSLPTLGQFPQTQSALAGLPVIPANPVLGTSQPVQFTSPAPISHTGCFSPHTQLTDLLPEKARDKSSSKNAIVVSSSSPPIPLKIAEAIWQGEFIDLSQLLPAKLGAEEPTVLDLFDADKKKKEKEKFRIKTIEQWIRCFNAFIAITARKQPDRIADLLAYSSWIVKQSQDYEGTPWLSYDTQLRKEAAADGNKEWASVKMNIWALHFGRATPKERSNDQEATGSKQTQFKTQNRNMRYQPYAAKRRPPACRNWNWSSCGGELTGCTYQHKCMFCYGPHKAQQCNQKKVEFNKQSGEGKASNITQLK